MTPPVLVNRFRICTFTTKTNFISKKVYIQHSHFFGVRQTWKQKRDFHSSEMPKEKHDWNARRTDRITCRCRRLKHILKNIVEKCVAKHIFNSLSSACFVISLFLLSNKNCGKTHSLSFWKKNHYHQDIIVELQSRKDQEKLMSLSQIISGSCWNLYVLENGHVSELI
jgi:hypothetical protein